MLVKFTVGNYMSFKDRVTIDMRTTAVHELPENIIKIIDDTELLKSVVIYGANASGKSNLIKAFYFARDFVVWSFKNVPAGEKIDVLGFVLNKNTKEQPSFFEVVLNVNNTFYRYNFEVNSERVVQENLYLVQKTKEEQLFKRNSNGYEISKKFEEGNGIQEKTRDNCLFLSVVSQFNGSISSEIVKFFKKFKVNSSIGYKAFYNRTLARLEEDPTLKQDILKFINIADKEIKGFEIETKKEDEQANKPGLKETIRKIVYFAREVFNDKKELQGEVLFGLDYLESEGTRKMFALSIPIIDAIKNGEIIIIDELENHLHPLLLKYIIKLFNSYSNEKAQLIIATHNLTCMNSECFRRDQIWFTEKNSFGESTLFSLVDYKTNDNKKVRNDASYGKDYLLGKYGAVPYLNEIDLCFKGNEK